MTITTDGSNDEDAIVEIDAQEFTFQERQRILQVVARDEDIHKQEKERLRNLQKELRDLVEIGIPDDSEERFGRCCKRCRLALGYFFNSGALCPNCEKKVCKKCRVTLARNASGWICSVCSKARDICAGSGAWFYGNQDLSGNKTRKVYGSMLVKKVFSIGRKKDKLIYKEPSWNEIVKNEPMEEIAIEESDLPHVIEPVLSVIPAFDQPESSADSGVGKVQIGLKYDHNVNLFEVQVHQAKDLSTDSSKSSICPYIKVYLIDLDGHSHGKKKTKAKKNTSCPEFDEILMFEISYDVLINCTCIISVWHYEFSGKNNSIGETTVSIQEIQDSGLSLENPVPQWYVLHTKVNAPRDAKLDRRFSGLSLPSLYSMGSSGSMLSIYSDAGGQAGNLAISGDIFFSLHHNTNLGIFEIHIEKAKDIVAVDSKQGFSNPYCKVYLYPDQTKSSKKKTMYQRKTINPTWNETIKYKMTRKDLLDKTLQVSVWNHDRFGRNDFLGEVQINIREYASTNDLDSAIPNWYTLQELAPISVGASSENRGNLKMRLKFIKQTLQIQVIQASGLYSVSPEKLPNPFVKCFFLPDKSRKSKKKTSVKKKSVSPIWEETFEYKGICTDDLYSRVLEVTVWDYNTSAHQFLGGARLGLPHGDEYWHDCFDAEVEAWEALMKSSGALTECDIPLRATMTSRKGQSSQILE